MTTTRQYRDAHIDVKFVLSTLWIAMLLVFAYVDIFGFFRADVINAALAGTVGTAGLAVNQVFLASTLIYITVPTLMVVLSLVLKARVNRIVNLVVSPVYAVTIVGSCIGEEWIYYLVGSAVEVVLLAGIVRFAWKWPVA